MKKEKKKSGKKETSKAEENATSDMVELQRTRVICGPDINLYVGLDLMLGCNVFMLFTYVVKEGNDLIVECMTHTADEQQHCKLSVSIGRG